MKKLIVGISGASGIILALKTIKALLKADYHIDLVITSAALATAKQELGLSTPKKILAELPEEGVTLHSLYDFSASIASGSYKTEGMIIVPCSMSTLAGVALGLSDNLLRRAADVCLKEKRPLVLVPRESPFSAIHLRHMLTLSEMGAHIVPPLPAWYNLPKTLNDIEDFIVGKILDSLKIAHRLYPIWPLSESPK